MAIQEEDTDADNGVRKTGVRKSVAKDPVEDGRRFRTNGEAFQKTRKEENGRETHDEGSSEASGKETGQKRKDEAEGTGCLTGYFAHCAKRLAKTACLTSGFIKLRVADMKTKQTIKLGISSYLLGNNVRYDGGHELDQYILDTFDRIAEWVPGSVPELASGMPVPRGPMKLVGDVQQSRA